MTVRFSDRDGSMSVSSIGSGAYSYTWEHPNRWSRMYEMLKKVFGKDTDLFIMAMEENSKSLEDHLDFAYIKGNGGELDGNLSITGDLVIDGVTVNPVPIPAGSIMMYGGLSLPLGGWLWCDGAEYDSADYGALVTAIGGFYDTSAGQAAPASGFFRVPVFTGRIPVGSNAGVDLGDVGEVTFAAGNDEPGYIVVNYIIKT